MLCKQHLPKTPAERQAEWRAQQDLRAAFQKLFTEQLTHEFTIAGQQAANAYIDHGQGAETAAIRQHAIRLHALIKRLYLSVGRAFAERSRDSIQTEISKGYRAVSEIKTGWTEQELMDYLGNWADKWAAKKVTQISGTTEARINAAIVNGLQNPDATTQSIADDIEATTGGLIGPYRALLIATTETHSAANEGNFAGAQSLGLNLQKFWIATDDDHTREDHADVDTDPINMEDTFTVGEDELLYPGDPSGSAEEIINCRCVLGYAEAAQ